MISNTLVIKYCPSCGVDRFKRVAEKLFECGGCGFQYFHNSAAAAAVILEHKDNILLTVRKFDPHRGSYDLPGGFIDYNETGEEGLIREIKEELNLTVEKVRYFGSYPNEYLYKEVLYHTLDLVFIASISNTDGIRVADDVMNFVWIKPKDIDLNSVAVKSIKSALTVYVNKLS